MEHKEPCFPFCFGAGVILFVGRQENRVEGLAPADYFFRRQLWLMAFSLFDVFVLLWNGDILFDYACLGMIIFVFRKLSPKTLILTALVCLLFMTARDNRNLYLDKSVISHGEEIAAMDTTKVRLTPRQKVALEEMTAFKKRATKESKLKRTNDTNEIVRGSYADVYKWRTDDYINSIVEYLYLGPWDVLIFMFLGMAFFKSGILTGDRSVKLYATMAALGLGIGLSLSFLRLSAVVDHDFNYFEHAKNTHISYFQCERLLRSLGIFGLIMLMYKSGIFGWFFALLRPAGQMALTNYLTQSLICGAIFNGYGFAMFGKLQRYEMYVIVLAVWVFQITFSMIWMRYFLYGPAEWLWRSLTYWKPQPFLRRAPIIAPTLS